MILETGKPSRKMRMAAEIIMVPYLMEMFFKVVRRLIISDASIAIGMIRVRIFIW